MSLPTATEYLEAVQTPSAAFGHPFLQGCRADCNPMGLPLSWSGAFATVFRLRDPQDRFHALRCFTQRAEGLPERYRAYQRFLGKVPQELRARLLACDYIERGIRGPGSTPEGPWLPVLRMDWCPGRALGSWVAERVESPAQLRWLQNELRLLARLMESAKFVHGDLQHNNILVGPTGPVLVDYDNLIVPGMPRLPITTQGLPGFRHPKAPTQGSLAARDRFAFLVLYVALESLIHQPQLHQQWGSVEGLLFQSRDFKKPAESPLFNSLQEDSRLRDMARKFIEVCRRSADAVPTLDQAFPSEVPPAMALPSRLAPLSIAQEETLGRLYGHRSPPPDRVPPLHVPAAPSQAINTPTPITGAAAASTSGSRRAWWAAALLMLIGSLSALALPHPPRGPRSLLRIRATLERSLDQRKDHLIRLIVHLDEQREALRGLPEGVRLARIEPGQTEASSCTGEQLSRQYAQVREEARRALLRCDQLLSEFDARPQDAARLAELPDLPPPIRDELRVLAAAGGTR